MGFYDLGLHRDSLHRILLGLFGRPRNCGTATLKCALLAGMVCCSGSFGCTTTGCGFSLMSLPPSSLTVLGCFLWTSSMVGTRFCRFLLTRLAGFLVATFSLPSSFPRSTSRPLARASLIDSRTVSRARLASAGFAPVFWTISATIVFLVEFGIVISIVLLAGGRGRCLLS